MDIETTQEILLEQLTANTVNVRVATFAEINGTTVQIGGYTRKAYGNSETGRQQIADELPENYVNAILAVWGDEATVADPEQPETEETIETEETTEGEA